MGISVMREYDNIHCETQQKGIEDQKQKNS